MDIHNNRFKMFPLVVAVITMLIIVDFLVLILESQHCLKSVGIRVIVTKFDVNDDVSMSVSQALNHYVTPCL